MPVEEMALRQTEFEEACLDFLIAHSSQAFRQDEIDLEVAELRHEEVNDASMQRTSRVLERLVRAGKVERKEVQLNTAGMSEMFFALRPSVSRVEPVPLGQS